MAQAVLDKTGPVESRPRKRTLLLAGLIGIVLVATLGGLIIPRLFTHPSLLDTYQPLQGSFTPIWASNGQTVTLSSPGGYAYAWNLAANTITKRNQPQCAQQSPALSSYIDTYMICSDFSAGTIQVFDQTTGARTINYTDNHNYDWNSYALSTDGTKVAFLSREEVFQVWDLQTGKVLQTVQLPTSIAPPTLSWSPDQKKLAVHYFGPTIQIWDLAGKRLLTTLRDSSISNQDGSLAWSADSSRIGYASTTPTATQVDIWNATNGQPFLHYQMAPLNTLSTFMLLANGQSFLLQTSSRQLLLVNAQSKRTLLNITLPLTYTLDISPDTTLIELITGKSIAIDDALTGLRVTTYTGLSASYALGDLSQGTPIAMQAAWSPNSQSLASAGPDGHLHIWDAHTGQDHSTYDFQMAFPSALQWSPDSHMVAVTTMQGNIQTPVTMISAVVETAYVVSTPN